MVNLCVYVWFTLNVHLNITYPRKENRVTANYEPERRRRSGIR
jgi:hypothetical protein